MPISLSLFCIQFNTFPYPQHPLYKNYGLRLRCVGGFLSKTCEQFVYIIHCLFPLATISFPPFFTYQKLPRKNEGKLSIGAKQLTSKESKKNIRKTACNIKQQQLFKIKPRHFRKKHKKEYKLY